MKIKKGFTPHTKNLVWGFSLIEILVVITIFAVIGILTTQAVTLTLKSGRKSDSMVRTRENVNYALAVIERQIRGSENITPCTGSASPTLSYTTLEDITSSFTCVTPGASGYIASGSGRLTSSDISVTSCSFTCTQTVNNPAVVKVNIVAEDNTTTSTEKGSVTTQTEIVVRNY